MPANKNALIRYRIIDRCISNKYNPYPTLQNLTEACADVVGRVSLSQIEKDMENMRNESSLDYNAPIKYCRKNKGYYYSDPDYTISSLNLNKDEIESIAFASTILRQFKDIDIFKVYGDAVERIFQAVKIKKTYKNQNYQNIIHFEKAADYRGTEHIPNILSHITEKETIEFNYHSFENNSNTWRCLHPYVLKEYRNRWYVVGLDNIHNEIRTYALDRIIELKKGNYTWKETVGFDAEKFFKHSFGIYYVNTLPENVILSFTPYEKKYVKSQPIHFTQEILIDNEDEYRIQIKVFIEYDLLMYIRSCGEHVTVIEPTHLKETIKKSLIKSLENY